VAIDDDTVTFRYRDRAHGDVVQSLRLDGVEFLRRILLHVLPRRFVRIRSYGLLANRNRNANLARCREALGTEPDDARNSEAAQETWQETAARQLGQDPFRCPACGQGHLAPVTEIQPHARPPPLGRPPVRGALRARPSLSDSPEPGEVHPLSEIV